MQQFSFSKGQTGLHLAHMPHMLNLCSSRVCWRPFATLVSVTNFCDLPQNSGCTLVTRITVSFCFLWLPPFDLFISKAQRASGPSKVCTEDWSNTKSVMQLGCASSKIAIT